jgi:hypothetical protein
LQRYALGNPNTINRNKKTLKLRDIIEDNAQGGYQFVDPLYELWFRQGQNH